MGRWRDELLDVVREGAHRVETRLDRWKARWRERLGRFDKAMIQPYRGYGTTDRVFLEGRVLGAKELAKPQEDDSWWKNLLAMYNRFDTDEIPGAKVEAELLGTTATTTSDEEGYLRFEFECREPLPVGRWHDVRLQLIPSSGPQESVDGNPVEACGSVLVPGSDAEYGVISDIDDTVLQSHVTNWKQMVRTVLFKNAKTRLPFDGVAEFYQALVAGSDGERGNPIFYVSSSSWHLYDLLVDFFEVQSIPRGPLLLRDLGLERHRFITAGHDHKLEKIERILSTYPNLSFILIGDSGQRDPEIYVEAMRNFPGRILAAYIRDVHDKRRERVERRIAEAREAGSEMRLVHHTSEAADHAGKAGLISGSRTEYLQRGTSSESGS